jgi:hypothetical protein
MDHALAKNSSTSSKEVWITGRFDDAARNEFDARRRKVIENAEGKLTNK